MGSKDATFSPDSGQRSENVGGSSQLLGKATGGPADSSRPELQTTAGS